MMLIGQTQQAVTLEVNRWKARWELYPTDKVKTRPSLLDIGTCKQKIVSAYCILKIYLTMPPSTATTERSFSVLKRVKTELRATM
jgi:hypothetical protein